MPGSASPTSPLHDRARRRRECSLKNGDFIPFDVPGRIFTAGWDINPARRAVGVYQDSAGRFHGFIVDRHWHFATLDYPAATLTRAFGINPRGDVVGNYVDAANRTHGFLASENDEHDHEGDEERRE